MKFYIQSSACCNGKLAKILLVMRLSFILLLAGVLQVNAKTYGQQLTLNKPAISIRKIFKAIKVQTGYDVLWQPEKLNADQKISVNFNQTSLDQVMTLCLINKGLNFTIEDSSIVIKSNQIETKIQKITDPLDSIIYRGKVTDEKGRPMVGATVKIVGGRRSTFTSGTGDFKILATSRSSLQVSYIGYISKQISLLGLNVNDKIQVSVTVGDNNLGEVNVVSTGYQDLPKERATGSFEVITKEQLQHSTDPNLVNRLKGITTSMNFNENLTPNNSAAGVQPSPITNLTIRGKNTLTPNFSSELNNSGQVLVVIDGIASPYSIDLVNPDDVESITVLKDAAAASIWGSRAANGVIVIKTKRGNYDQPLKISFNSNMNITEKLDLFYQDKMSTSDYINSQIFNFNSAGRVVADPTNVSQAQRALSPVTEILNAQKLGKITNSEANMQIDALRNNDVRKDFTNYFLRNSVNQNYSLSLNGGSKKMSFNLSAGYSNSLKNTLGANSDRIVLNYSTSYHPLKNLDIQANISYNQQNTSDQAGQNVLSPTIGSSGGVYLYTRLVDSNGSPTNIPFKYRPIYLNLLSTTFGDKLLPLNYNPLEDIKDGYYKTISRGINFNVGATYNLTPILSFNIAYNHNLGTSGFDRYYSPESFYMRDLINSYTNSSSLNRQLPYGAIYLPTEATSHNQTLRGQVNVNKNWRDKHNLNAIAGADVGQFYSRSVSLQYLGYNPETLASYNQQDYVDQFPLLYSTSKRTGSAQLPYLGGGISDSKSRTISFYSNAAYTYLGKYTFSGSIRKDESSQFGLGTNKGGTPYYSFGSSWNLTQESFYKLDWLPKLQFRATFGYNGNVNAVVSARPLINYIQSNGPNNLLYAFTDDQATNNQLRPEKTGILNLGLDFGFRNNRISGSIEYYRKVTTDLIDSNPIDPTTGYNVLAYNTANLLGRGIDFTLNSINLQGRLFSWTSSFLFSYNRVKVTKLYQPEANLAYQLVEGSPNYNVGSDLTRLFAYRWAGLNHDTGDPQGYFNGKTVVMSTDVSGVNNISDVERLDGSTAHYFGSAVPVYYGSLRNNFTYDGFQLSVNLRYELGYYFRRSSSSVVAYNQLNSGIPQSGDYEKRWQKPGDELHTNVPSETYPSSLYRDSFYYYSDINVLKGDNIRLQEVNFSYVFKNKNWFIKNPRIFTSVSNLGVIWTANKEGIDPDANDYPLPHTYSLGLSANF